MVLFATYHEHVDNNASRYVQIQVREKKGTNIFIRFIDFIRFGISSFTLLTTRHDNCKFFIYMFFSLVLGSLDFKEKFLIYH